MGHTLEDIGEKVGKVSDQMHELHEEMEGYKNHKHHRESEKEDNKMGDIAGLMALMQGNKGMDLPGLLALCKDKGADKGFGGEGMFMFVFLILFLFAGGGLGGLGNKGAAQFAEAAGGSCQQILDLYSKIDSGIVATNTGFSNLNTFLCTSIAEVIASVRNQGDRSVEASNSVSRQLSDCCCALQSKLDTILCGIRELGSKVELMQERNVNALIQMESRLTIQGNTTQQMIKDTNCLIERKCQEQELARLARENAELKNGVLADATADRTVRSLERFLVHHYVPNTGGAPATSGA